jgi:hypothetical protein
MTEMPKIVSVQDPNGKLVDVSTAAWSADFWDYMLCYAWGVRMQRSTASAKDAQKAKQTIYDGMVKGEIPERGPSGPRIDAEGRADVAWFATVGRKVAAKDLDQAWIERTAVLLVNGKKAETPGAALEMVKADPSWIDKAKQVVRGTEEWKTFHAAEAAKDKGKSADVTGLAL